MFPVLAKMGRLGWAGLIFQIGNASLFVASLVNGATKPWPLSQHDMIISACEIGGGAAWFLSARELGKSDALFQQAAQAGGSAAETLMKQSNRHFTLNCLIGVGAWVLTSAEGLTRLSAPTMVGLAFTTLSYGVVGPLCKKMHDRFGNHKKRITRWTLGRPRLLVSLGGLVGAAPMALDFAAAARQTGGFDFNSAIMAVALVTFAIGEGLVASTLPQQPILRRAAAPAAAGSPA